MQTFKIKIEKKETTKVEIELPIPSFFRDDKSEKYIGLLDENTVTQIIDDEYEKMVNTYNNKRWDAGLNRLTDAYNTFLSCTESEFVEKMDKVIESITSKTAA